MKIQWLAGILAGILLLGGCARVSEETRETPQPPAVIYTYPVETIPTTPPEPEDGDFVRILDYIPEAYQALPYATTENFTGTVIYDFTDAWLRYGTVKKLKAVSEKLVTSQMRSALKKAGFTVYTASKYLTSDKYLARGDILLNDDHHTAINLSGTTTTTAPAASKNPYSEPNYTVMRGSTGSGVKWVQWELTRIKYSVGSSGIDGIFGKDTYAAVLKFQKKWFSSSKEWDGIVGKKTRAALKSA